MFQQLTTKKDAETMTDTKFNDQDIQLILATIEKQVSTNGRTNSETVYMSVAGKLHESMTMGIFKPMLTEAFRNGSLPAFTTKLGRTGGIVRADGMTVAVPKAIVAKPIEVVSSAVMKTYAPAPVVEPEWDAKKELLLQALETAKAMEAETQVLMNAGVSPALLAKPDRPYLATVPKAVKAEPLRNVLYEPGAMFYLMIGEERFKVPCAQVYVQTLLEKVFNAAEDVDGNVEFMGKRYVVENTSMLEGVLMWFMNCAIVRGVVKKENDR